MDAEAIINPSPRPFIPVGSRGEPASLGKHIYMRVKDGPLDVLIDLRAIGPLAVNHAIQGVIHANQRLVAQGNYLSLVPSKKVVERRPSKDDASPEYGDSNATILVLCLKVCD